MTLFIYLSSLIIKCYNPGEVVMSYTLLVPHKCNLHLIDTATETYNYFNCKTCLPLWVTKSSKAELNQLTIYKPRLSGNGRRWFPSSSESSLHHIIKLVSFQSLFQITDSNTLLNRQILHLFNISAPVWRQESEQIFRHLLTFFFLLLFFLWLWIRVHSLQWIYPSITSWEPWQIYGSDFWNVTRFIAQSPRVNIILNLLFSKKKHQTKRELQLSTSETKRKNWSASYK